jgi:monofunctional biosynthetic peptidoglycan transglycosylase
MALLVLATIALLPILWLVADIGSTWLRFRPQVAAMVGAAPEMTSYMELRTAQGHPPRLRQWAPIGSLPAPLVCVIVASEDNTFFLYETVDWRNQRAAARRALRGDMSRGGSGITQQLARNMFLGPERTVRRKVREIVLAYQISRTLSKERVLELYLNSVEWGDGVWGVAAASQHLFERAPSELTPTQIVLLANLLPAPSRGLAFALSPGRRIRLVRLTTDLWREGLLDDITRTSTTARIERIGNFIDLGMTPTAAFEAVRAEMGPERLAIDDGLGNSLLLRERCDRGRRGVVN